MIKLQVLKFKLSVLILAYITLTAVLISGCDGKPKDYYVLCDNLDARGWKLVDVERRDGYLMSCTYQSPDKKLLDTMRCNDSGCD